MILAYYMSAYAARTFFYSGKEPAGTFCTRCGCVRDDSYVPDRVSMRNRYDVASTYDKRTIVNEAFRRFCRDQGMVGVDFVRVNERSRLYLLRIHNVLRIDTRRSNTRFGALCGKCGRRSYIAGVDPLSLLDVKAPIAAGLFRSDLCFGSTCAKTPLKIAGIETKARIEAREFRGLYFTPITS